MNLSGIVLNFDHKCALTNIIYIKVSFLDVPSQGLGTIKLPCKMRKRGRLKGADKTVIGLPIERNLCRGNKPVSFLYKVLNKRN